MHDELLRNIVNRPPLPFSARGVAAWPAVETVLKRGLAKSAGERFPDVSALSGSFASALRQPKLSRKWFDSTESALAAPIAAARNLQFSAEPPLYRAWFALRAASAFDDAELLAAADIFAGQRPALLCRTVGRRKNCAGPVRHFRGTSGHRAISDGWQVAG